ncbi:hypothetical protein B0J11DRAFT_447755 [Dendryphion nanum]|uniref:Uncharacterized protein n=1 Tax=Dendryphion nanum TaxID=256645 RepID=A0A9P9D1X5_9PLEO|nr:hypothetical protein B0J11DRAFT_447755 [Dendryphion nanum]
MKGAYYGNNVKVPHNSQRPPLYNSNPAFSRTPQQGYYPRPTSSTASKGDKDWQPTKEVLEKARKAGIPEGFNLKNWDLDDEPILLMGSAFGANSLGKWIHKWTLFCYKEKISLGETARELSLLLDCLNEKSKRADKFKKLKIFKTKEDEEMIDDFLEGSVNLWKRFLTLLKTCEEAMWEEAKKESNGDKPTSMSTNSGKVFIDTIFGWHYQLKTTNELMAAIRLWSFRFDANCNDILRKYNV